MRRLALDSIGWEATPGAEDDDWRHEEQQAPFPVPSRQWVEHSYFHLRSGTGLFVDRAASV